MSYNLSSYQNKRVTITELRNKNDRYMISCNNIKKIENIPCEEISNNCNLLISHIILKKLMHVSSR